MLRNALIVVGLVGAASLAGHLYVTSQVYYPVVEIATPEGLNVVALLAETPDRHACGAANETLLAPIKQQCKDCKVAMARCERSLEGPLLAMAQGEPLPHYQVVSPNVRLSIVGEAKSAKLGCEQLAATLVRSGVPGAACLAPRLSAPKG